MRLHSMHCAVILLSSLLFLAIAINCFNAHDDPPALVLNMCGGGCGLGNQMFVYASGLGLALQNPAIQACVSGVDSTMNLVHPQSIMSLHVDLMVKPLRRCTMQTTGEAGYFWWWLLGIKFASLMGMIDLFQAPMYEPFRLREGRTTIIDGYLESFKYFQNVPHPIFRLKEHRAARRWMLQRGLTSVVHVRRGDKVLEWPVAPVSFYENAFKLLGSNRVAVCTDDVAWVLGQEVFRNASVSINHGVGFDMALLAAATDTVIFGIGTFGWWGAYLSKAKRKIFYPHQMNPQMAAAYGYRELDFIPYNVTGQGEWIPVSA
jgi:hypothetical protein